MQKKTDGMRHMESASGSNLKGCSICIYALLLNVQHVTKNVQVLTASFCVLIFYMCDNNCYDYNEVYLGKHIHRVHTQFLEVPQEHDNSEFMDISGFLDTELCRIGFLS